MNVFFGMAALAAVITLTVRFGHGTQFTGVFHGPSLFLLGLAPLCIAVISHRPRDLAAAARVLWEAMRFDAERSRATLYDELTRFAAEIRQRRPAQAMAIADSATHELLRQLGPLIVRQYSSAALEDTAATANYVHTSSMKRAEEVFTALSRVAPAVGLVGTVLGLISLLNQLSNFDRLGPSMALALLCTFYGLLLANGLYAPLARLIHTRLTVAVEESRLVTRALVLLREDKPLSDIRKLFEEAAGAAAVDAPAPSIALDGGR